MNSQAMRNKASEGLKNPCPTGPEVRGVLTAVCKSCRKSCVLKEAYEGTIQPIVCKLSKPPQPPQYVCVWISTYAYLKTWTHRHMRDNVYMRKLGAVPCNIPHRGRHLSHAIALAPVQVSFFSLSVLASLGVSEQIPLPTKCRHFGLPQRHRRWAPRSRCRCWCRCFRPPLARRLAKHW